MPDLDEILAADRGVVTRAAADAARLPDFSDVARRGRHQRNLRRGTAVGIAAIAAATVVGGVQLLDAGGAGVTEPVGPAAPSRSLVDDMDRDEREARRNGQLGEHIVGSEQSVPVDVASSGDVRATLWRNDDGIALSVVDDAGDVEAQFEVAAGTTVWPASDGRFVVVDGGDPTAITVVHRDGYGVEVEVGEQPTAVADDEVAVAVGTQFGEYDVYAVDVDDATAHPVAGISSDVFEVRVFGDRIVTQQSVGETAQVEVRWSDDGGATWMSGSPTSGTRHLVVPAAAGDPVLIETADGANPPPLDAVHVWDGSAWERTEYRGELPAMLTVAYDEPEEVGFVHASEVRVLAELWGRGENMTRESGIFAWTGFELEAVESGAPDVTDRTDPSVVSVQFEDDQPVLWLSDEDGTLLRSDDGGATFEALEGR